MKRIKVRFNLGRGANYMKWKVEYPDGRIEYHRPSDVQLIMEVCQLKNQRTTAQKIFKGASKTVCAWVLCEEIELRTKRFIKDNQEKRVRYNPRVTPNWMYKNELADGKTFERLYSVDSGLYVF
jgi:hypothetical protein